MASKNRHILFVSHSAADSGEAQELAQRIRERAAELKLDLAIWIDVDSLTPGSNWQRQIEEAIQQHSTAFLVYVGSLGVRNWVDWEVQLALVRRRAALSNGAAYPFIPVFGQDTVDPLCLPGFARLHQAICNPLRNGSALDKLISAITGVIGGTTPDTTTRLVKEPFVGWDPFTEDNAHLFFGREDETKDVVEIRVLSCRRLSLTAALAGC